METVCKLAGKCLPVSSKVLTINTVFQIGLSVCLKQENCCQFCVNTELKLILYTFVLDTFVNLV